MPERICEQCGGTGYVVLMSSWFLSDKLRRETCWNCTGDGKSDVRVGYRQADVQNRLRRELAQRRRRAGEGDGG